MKTLLPAGVLLILLGSGFAWSAISGTGSLRPPSDVPAVTVPSPPAAPGPARSEGPRRTVLIEGGLAGLLLAAGLVAVGIGIGNWRHPRWSHTRPANPYSDQTGRGLV
jgi:hypothetical protein